MNQTPITIIAPYTCNDRRAFRLAYGLFCRLVQNGILASFVYPTIEIGELLSREIAIRQIYSIENFGNLQEYEKATHNFLLSIGNKLSMKEKINLEIGYQTGLLFQFLGVTSLPFINALFGEEAKVLINSQGGANLLIEKALQIVVPSTMFPTNEEKRENEAMRTLLAQIENEVMNRFQIETERNPEIRQQDKPDNIREVLISEETFPF